MSTPIFCSGFSPHSIETRSPLRREGLVKGPWLPWVAFGSGTNSSRSIPETFPKASRSFPEDFPKLSRRVPEESGRFPEDFPNNTRRNRWFSRRTLAIGGTISIVRPAAIPFSWCARCADIKSFCVWIIHLTLLLNNFACILCNDGHFCYFCIPLRRKRGNWKAV